MAIKSRIPIGSRFRGAGTSVPACFRGWRVARLRSEEHTSELQSRLHLVCRLLLEKKKKEHVQYWLVAYYRSEPESYHYFVDLQFHVWLPAYQPMHLPSTIGSTASLTSLIEPTSEL